MRLLNGTGDLEEARYGIPTEWREGDDENDGKEGAEAGEKVRKGARPMRSTMRIGDGTGK